MKQYVWIYVRKYLVTQYKFVMLESLGLFNFGGHCIKGSAMPDITPYIQKVNSIDMHVRTYVCTSAYDKG